MSDGQAFVVAVVSGLGMLLLVLPHTGAGRLWRHMRSTRLSAVRTDVWARAGLFGLIGGALTAGVFGVGPVAGVATAIAAGSGARLTTRVRARQDRLMQDAWPQLLDTVRVDLALMPVPLAEAFFTATARLPSPLRQQFVAAERMWVNTTDFPRCLRLIAATCDDPFTDVVCESLRTIAPVPAAQMSRRLNDVARDLRTTLRHIRDAEAALAGARFARRFVVIVPVVMAGVGLWVGEGRAAYQTAAGQLVGVVALTVILGCWWWAGRLLHLPEPPRVFAAVDDNA